jgi:hypothetical protein
MQPPTTHYEVGLITKFDDHRVGGGADINSSLGLFLSYRPEKALEYAESASEINGEGEFPYVYAVCFPAKCVYEMSDREEFYGVDPQGNPVNNSDDFSKLRRELVTQGFDCAGFEDGEDSMAVVMRPSKAIIIAVLDDQSCYALCGHEFDAMGVLISLKENALLLEPQASHAHELNAEVSL